MLLLLINFTFFSQPDTLDIIYDNFYQNKSYYREHINIISDKDYYYPGEYVSFFVGVNPLNSVNNIKSKWVQAFIFDDTKKLINHTRIYLNNGYALGSLLVPDSVNSKTIYLSATTEFTSDLSVKYLNILTSDTTFLNNSEHKIEVRTKNKYLLPNKLNEIIISSNITREENAAITTENGEPVLKFLLKKSTSIRFIPKVNKKYFLTVFDKKIKLPNVKPSADMEATLSEDEVHIDINNIESDASGNILLVFSGQEILWLSHLNQKESKIEFPIDNTQYSYLFCFLLDKKLNILDRKILNMELPLEQIAYNEKNDTLSIIVPSQVKNFSLLATSVESNYKINRLTFSSNEKNELSYYGSIPNNIYFSNYLEKQNWLNYYFKVNLKSLIQKVEKHDETLASQIVYLLPTDTKFDSKLKINASDYSGKIINHRREGYQIFINPNEFKNEWSMLMLSAYYKNRKLRLIKDSSAELKPLKNIISNFMDNTFYSHYFMEEDPLEYISQMKNNKNFIILNTITITDKKFRVQYRGRGFTKTFEELELDDHTNTVLELLPQIKVYDMPAGFSENLNYGHIKKGILVEPGDITVMRLYPMFVSIIGPSGIYYQGRDFNVLKDYPASWVYTITKKNSYPEGVTVVLKPGFRNEENLISYEKIFSQARKTDNLGAIHWDFIPSTETNQIKIPLTEISESLSWALYFFDKNRKVIEYKGIYEKEKTKY